MRGDPRERPSTRGRRLAEQSMSACDRIASRVRDTDDWKREHGPHGEPTVEPLAFAPEGYPARWLVCVCGAKYAFVPGKE